MPRSFGFGILYENDHHHILVFMHTFAQPLLYSHANVVN